MSRVPKARAALASLVVLASLITVASAGAAAWQGPFPLTDASDAIGDSSNVAAGTNGASAAGWWDSTNARSVLIRRGVGGNWSTAEAMTNENSQVSILSAVDGAGNVTAAFTGATSAFMATWPAAAANLSCAPLPAPGGGTMQINGLAVNPQGDAVLSAQQGADLIVGYRHGPTGSFDLRTYPGVSPLNSAVAINLSGMAVVVFKDTAAGLKAVTRTAGTDWPLVAESVTAKTVPTAEFLSTVGIDVNGNAWTAFTYANAGATVVRTALRPPGGGWQESPDLSNGVTGFTASQVQIAVNPSGRGLLAWKQVGPAASDGNILARDGYTGTGIWGPIETVNDAGADRPAVAISEGGQGAVVWERATTSGNIGQARIREYGNAGAWGDIHNLNSLHTANFSQPSIATDGHDFVTGTAPDTGVHPALISVYDETAPRIDPIAVSGPALAGVPLTLSATATDIWSTVGAPAWTFSDGGTASGATVTHAFAAAGTYTAHVAVTDSSANTSSADVTINVSAAQATLTSTKFKAKWKRSKVSGTLVVAGNAPRAGTYAIDLKRGKTNVNHLSLNLPAGAFSHTYKLSAKFLPGIYDVTLTPSVPANQITPAAGRITLKAPPEGVVDVAFLSGARNGTAARTLTGASTIWASFHFAARPGGKLTLTWYKLGKKRVRLGATSKDPATRVVSYIKSAAAFTGTYQAVLSRKGVVIAQVSVKAK